MKQDIRVNSIEYYNKNAKDFFDRTINADLSFAHEKFLSYLPSGSSILDAGCGVGRDAKYFKDLGYPVTACDGSLEMTRIATQILGQEVRHVLFQDLDYQEKFDAIWCCAALLHVPYTELREVIQKLHKALKPDGILFVCFKYGTEQRVVEERAFYDMNEKLFLPYIEGLFDIKEDWQIPDIISKVGASPSKTWFHAICQKI